MYSGPLYIVRDDVRPRGIGKPMSMRGSSMEFVSILGPKNIINSVECVSFLTYMHLQQRKLSQLRRMRVSSYGSRDEATNTAEQARSRQFQ